MHIQNKIVVAAVVVVVVVVVIVAEDVTTTIGLTIGMEMTRIVKLRRISKTMKTFLIYC
ncbi:hypothetical protein PBV87_05855 [Niameybacter massiliensis]|uniref:Uncharacterized protein n=1 Tax=Holtiella tumoricola TaxID=3018743 RepID=A0AA42DLT6_9FIRM|nr:hypothetical protein [Holtiella tumoricola]MDA3731023.1 hypothetical protein [Holtiella tumoricola]